MERPTKAVRTMLSEEEQQAPRPQRSLSREDVSYPASPSPSEASMSSTSGSKRKSLIPTRSIKKARQSENFTINSYLQKNPQLIMSRIQGDILDLSGLSITGLDGLLTIPGIQNVHTISLNHNAISQIERKDFAGLSQLITLDLSNNDIEILATDGFAELTNLTNLFLNNNRIFNFEHDSFAGLNSLKKLSLAHNRLTVIPQKMFAGAHNLEELFLQDNAINDIEKYAFADIPLLKKLKLNKNQLTKLTGPMFEGTPYKREQFSGRDKLNALQELDLRDNKLTEISTSILVHVPNLQIFLLANNQINQITNANIAALKKASHLKTINLVSNRLSDADLKKLKAALPNVKIIATVSMEITQMAQELMKISTEEHKKFAEEEHKKIAASKSLSDFKKQIAHEQVEREIHASDILSGINKSITDLINSKNFDFRTYLISWANKYIPYSPITFWYKLRNLGLTSLEGLKELPHIKDIYLIDLNHNLISTIPAGIFSGLSELDDIDLSNNKIATIDPMAFANLPKLNQLDLSFNLLTDLKPNTFREPHNLHILLLDGNGIENLPSELFKNLTELQTLSLGDNKLKQITSDNLVGLENLETLNLSNNKINYLNPAIFKVFKNLKRLNITDNPLDKNNLEAIKEVLPNTDINF